MGENKFLTKFYWPVRLLHLRVVLFLSVYMTNSTSNLSTACQCRPRSDGFHPEPRFAVPMPHQILPGLNHCLTGCFSSFLQLLRRRSHVRIVLGRPKSPGSVPDTWFTSGTDHIVYSCRSP